MDFDEPGVCLSFEETAEELTANLASLGFDVAGLDQVRRPPFRRRLVRACPASERDGQGADLHLRRARANWSVEHRSLAVEAPFRAARASKRYTNFGHRTLV